MKPKMQLSPDVPVTDAFRAEMNAWMIDFFGYEEEQIQPIVYNDANLISPAKKQQKVKRTRTQVQPDNETFSSLLEGLHDSFSTMRVPTIRGSWLEKRNVNAIKKMGVYVPTPFGLEFFDYPIVPAETSLPAIATAFFIPKKYDAKDAAYPRFAFAIKAAKLPANVESCQGTPYQFGQCFEMDRTEDGKDMSPKVLWVWCWMVVKSDGSIRIPHEKRQITSVITHKKSANGSRQDTAYLRQWCIPSIAIAEQGRDQSMHEKMMMCTFRQLLVWWADRPNQWSVGVRKDGHRVTFSISKEHTSAYFADRDTVVNVEGKPKKIIHFVRQHERSNGSIVKAHIRGLREFNWKGYECAVTAPRFNGEIFTNVPIDPIEMDKKYIDETVLTTDQLATRMADLEDRR